MENEPVILIIDDQPDLLRGFSKILRQQGFNVTPASSGHDGIQRVKEQSVSVAMISMDISDCEGTQLIKDILQLRPETVCIALASQAKASGTLKALEAGALDYFLRPITDWGRFYHLLRQSMNVWERSCELSSLRKRMRRLQDLRDITGFDKIKGSSVSVQAVMSQVKQVAPLEVSTLIYGESGVGKELVARAIHKESPHSEAPFVAVNCAAIQPDLFESELFGHARGAFTGAHSRREGLCGAAGHGTLFLDEIGELPLPLQPKLLRLLEQRTFRPVGGDSLHLFHARVIAATNVDLEAAVEESRFRKDLYYRLSAQEIFVPPLRDRIEDVQILAYHFLEKYNHLCQGKVQRIGPGALRMLESHDWGNNNVRELEREIQRGVVRAAGWLKQQRRQK